MKKLERIFLASLLLLSISCGKGSPSTSSLSWSYVDQTANMQNKVTVCERLVEAKEKREKIANLFKGFFNMALSAIPYFKVDLGAISENFMDALKKDGADSTIYYGEKSETDSKIFPGMTENCDPQDIQIQALANMIKDIYNELKTAINDVVESAATDKGNEVASMIAALNLEYEEVVLNPAFYYTNKDGKGVKVSYDVDGDGEDDKQCTDATYLSKKTSCKYPLKLEKVPKGSTIKMKFDKVLHDNTFKALNDLISKLGEFKSVPYAKMLQRRDDPGLAGEGVNLPLLSQAVLMTILPTVSHGLNLAKTFIQASRETGVSYVADDEKLKDAYKKLSDTLYNMVYDANEIIKKGVDLKDEKDAEPQIVIVMSDLPLFKIHDRNQANSSNKDPADEFVKDWGVDDQSNNWHNISEFEQDKKGNQKRETRYEENSKEWEKFELMIDEGEGGDEDERGDKGDYGIAYRIVTFGADHGYQTKEGKLDLRGRIIKFPLPLEGSKKHQTQYVSGEGKTLSVIQFDITYYKSDVFKDAFKKALVKLVMDEELDDKTGAPEAKKILKEAQDDYTLLKYMGGVKEDGRSLETILEKIKAMQKEIDESVPKKKVTRPDQTLKLVQNSSKAAKTAGSKRPDKK